MAPDSRGARGVSSLYGGYWNFDVQDFCYMTNRYFPPKELLDTLSANLTTLVGAYPSTNWHLSSLVAEPLGLTGDELVVGNGASELIAAITQMRVKHLAIPIPAFDEYLNRARTLGRTVSPFAMDPDFRLDVDRFIAHVKGCGANAVVIVQPNNPAGTLVSKLNMVRMLEAFDDLDLVVVDESFLYFAGAAYREISVAGLVHEFPNLVIANSMSKAYGVPGLRLGYAVSGDRAFVKQLRTELPIWSVNSLAQFFLEHLDHYRSEFEASCAQVREATQALYRGLLDVPFLTPYPTDGNYVLCRTSAELTGTDVTERLFAEFNVLVNDCSGKSGLDARFFRIASKTTEENEQLVSMLQAMTQSGTAMPQDARS